MIAAELSPSALPPLLEALARTLLHFLWQGLALGSALVLTRRLSRRAEASTRYLAACLTMTAMALAPLLTLSLIYVSLTRSAPVDPAAVLVQLATAPRPVADSVMGWLLVAWTIGAALMAARLAGGWGYLRLVLTRRASALDTSWQQRVDRLARRLGLTRRVVVRGAHLETGPMLVGWLRPVILLPLSLLSSLPKDYLEALLLHELAHVRRHDQVIHLIQSVVEALLFYHPCVWWVSRKICVEREFCCDDLVLAQTEDRVAYAQALAALADTQLLTLATTSPATGGSLMTRIQRIIHPNPRNERHELLSNLTLLLLAGALSLGALGFALAQGRGGDGIAIAWMPRSIRRLAPLFRAAGARHGVDPALLAIMTLVESGGQSDARSTLGARGLMQIMPATAERIAQARGIQDFELSQLEEAELNIDFGAWYLAQQMKAFPSSDPAEAIALAAVAYNGGPRQLRAHLDEGQALRPETAHYRDLILAMWKERDAAHSPTFEAFIARLWSKPGT